MFDVLLFSLHLPLLFRCKVVKSGGDASEQPRDLLQEEKYGRG